MAFPEWLTLSSNNGNKNSVVDITSSTNNLGERTGVIVVKTKDLNVSINVTQLESEVTFTVVPNPIEGGTVNVSEFTLKYSGSQLLSAIPNDGYKFKRWELYFIDDSLDDDSSTIEGEWLEYFNGNTLIEAVFIKQHLLKTFANYGKTSPNNTIVEDNGQIYLYWETTGLDINNYDFVLDGWYTEANGQGTKLGTGSPFLLKNITADTNVYAYVIKTPKKRTITVNSNNTNMGTVSGGGEYDYGSTVTISATAKSGYYFVKWNDGNTDNPRTITVDTDHTYTADFAEMPYINLDKTELVFEAAGGTQYVNVSSNVEWTIS